MIITSGNNNPAPEAPREAGEVNTPVLAYGEVALREEPW